MSAKIRLHSIMWGTFITSLNKFVYENGILFGYVLSMAINKSHFIITKNIQKNWKLSPWFWSKYQTHKSACGVMYAARLPSIDGILNWSCLPWQSCLLTQLYYWMMITCDCVIQTTPNSMCDISSEVKYFTGAFRVDKEILPDYHSKQYPTIMLY